jgi:glyoxylase-like metal-dependent hydrolase (beta-lactamase superfamily II)
MQTVDLHLSVSGFCYAKENHSIRNGKKENIKFHALWGIIKHPCKGLILFDTGYTDRFYIETNRFPNTIYANLTKVEINKEDEVKAQLEKNGINPLEIKHIIISHFHADHIGGLCDFPNATFYCSQDALKQFLKIPTSIAFTKGILKNLVPIDFHDRIQIIEEISKSNTHPIFNQTFDLFSDQSIGIVSLPGHAAGQIGILLRTSKRNYFLVADAVWNREAFINDRLPNSIVRLFFHSWKDYKKSILKIKKFSYANPDAAIIPSHCWASYEKLISTKINWDVL